jgi:hypothetical protein
MSGGKATLSIQWGKMRMIEDDLPQFFDRARHNQEANKAAHGSWYQRIAQVNNCFKYGGQNPVNPQPAITGALFLRSQYAYKTAAGPSAGWPEHRSVHSSAVVP